MVAASATEESSELEMVKRTFEKLFDMDVKSRSIARSQPVSFGLKPLADVFEGLFSQIREGDDNVRDKVIEFLKVQVRFIDIVLANDVCAVS